MKNLVKIFTFVYFVGFNSSISLAKPNNDLVLNKLNFCKITKEAENNYEPENFEKTNNLLRETGQESLYCGEKIIITGRVVDQNCIPVSDAKVYIWQINCSGKYPYKTLKNNVDEKLLQTNKSMTFTGNGIATTNNNGEFHFITVYPPGVHNLGSHINIRVEHRDLGNLQSRLMLKGHKLQDPENYPSLSGIASIAVKKNVSIYDYQIVLPGNIEANY